MLNNENSEADFLGNFLAIKITTNTGISFGNLSNGNVALVYLIQALPVFFGFFIFIFTYDYLIDLGLCLLLFGGLCNIIDRAIVDVFKSGIDNGINAVVDYFYFPFINSAIFNLPDLFIIIGVILIVLTLIVNWILEYMGEDKNKKETPIKDVVLDEERNKKQY